jgi:hypothetical protein
LVGSSLYDFELPITTVAEGTATSVVLDEGPAGSSEDDVAGENGEVEAVAEGEP